MPDLEHDSVPLGELPNIDPEFIVIRPSRGLWAAVDDAGAIQIDTITSLDDPDRYFRKRVGSTNWRGILAARGWRIIRVDVIPHQPGPTLQSQENE